MRKSVADISRQERGAMAAIVHSANARCGWQPTHAAVSYWHGADGWYTVHNCCSSNMLEPNLRGTCMHAGRGDGEIRTGIPLLLDDDIPRVGHTCVLVRSCCLSRGNAASRSAVHCRPTFVLRLHRPCQRIGVQRQGTGHPPEMPRGISLAWPAPRLVFARMAGCKHCLHSSSTWAQLAQSFLLLTVRR